MTTKWQSQIYGKTELETVQLLLDDPHDDAWASTRRQVIRKDHQKCRRCNKKFDYDALTVHHILPREKGGTDELKNLITLCSPCHDFIECAYPLYSTRDEIEASALVVLEVSLPTKPSWHAVVYGGQRSSALLPVRPR